MKLITRFKTEKWQKINYRKGVAYGILKVVLGISMAVMFYCIGCIAEFPDWSAQQWAMHFWITGISIGVAAGTWFAAVLLGWAERRHDNEEKNG